METDPRQLLPRNKHDSAGAQAVVALGYPAVAPVLPQLLEWVQDTNWPASHPIIDFLITIPDSVVPLIWEVLRGDDHVWKYNCINCLISQMPANVAEQFRSELLRLAEQPTPAELHEDLPGGAQDALHSLWPSSHDQLPYAYLRLPPDILNAKPMTTPRPTTIPAYIDAAPAAGQAHLRRVYAILQKAAPHAEEVIKWNTPFFVEPRFLFAFSAHKSHLGFTTTPETLDPFRDALGDYEVTKMGILKVRYADALPDALIRRIAQSRVEAVREREDDKFW